MKKEIMNKMFKETNLDVIISFAYPTRLWYAKVITSDGFIFIEKDRADLIVDGRYIEYAKNNAKNVSVHLYKKGFFKEFAKTKTYKKIGIEKDYLTISQFNMIKKMFPKAQIITIIGQELRVIKSSNEIKNIKKACVISLEALESVKNMLRVGVKESEIDHHLNFKLKELGADKESFDSIVVSGARGALPHGKPSNKELQEGEIVTIDFGAYYKGYASDITRTFKIGTINDKKLNEIFMIVKEAQNKGIKAIKPGVKTDEIDKICRDYITKKGYGEYFLHSTGHGLGIEVHELPNIAKTNSKILIEGMVITIEPGIYIEGFGGVRFEDDILVTKNGYEVLSTK